MTKVTSVKIQAKLIQKTTILEFLQNFRSSFLKIWPIFYADFDKLRYVLARKSVCWHALRYDTICAGFFQHVGNSDK